jgi:hypothetical protein
MFILRGSILPIFSGYTKVTMTMSSYAQLSTIRLGCLSIPVEYSSELQAMGEWVSGTSPKIVLADDLAPVQHALTVIHELLHGLSDVYGVGLTERDVLCLEQGIAGFVQGNPEVALGLLREILGLPETP